MHLSESGQEHAEALLRGAGILEGEDSLYAPHNIHVVHHLNAGLHQAVEAKEGVPVQRENQTLASITFQNLFRMYGKLAGMTGTADTEAFEFQSIYGLEVVVIPTNKPMIRKDHPDAVFLNRAGKYRAVVAEIKDCYERGQPVLVGITTTSSP